jgi:hypothetical protein
MTNEEHYQSAFERAKFCDATVARMLRNGNTLAEIIGQLAAEKKQYAKRILELEGIASRKIVLPDGTVMMWQCPEKLIPFNR